MPIYIGDSSPLPAYFGRINSTMGSFTSSLSGSSDTQADINGSLNRALDSFTVRFRDITFPINGFAVQGSYAISNQDQQMGTEPYRTWNGNKDIVIYQWRFQDAARQVTEKAFLDWFDANHPSCKLLQYFVIDIKKSAIADARWQTSQLITGPNGNNSWFLHNSSGQQVEAKFDAALLWKGNEADGEIPNNAASQSFSEAFWTLWDGYWSVEGSDELIDGVYHDAIGPIPESVTVNNGATSSNIDYQNDGSASDVDNGGGQVYRNGLKAWGNAYQSRMGSNKAYWGNLARWGDQIGDGFVPSAFPLSSFELYESWDGGLFEHVQREVNLEPSGANYINDGGGDPCPSKFFRRLAIMQTALKRHADSAWGRSLILLDCDLASGNPMTDLTKDAYRTCGALAALGGAALGGIGRRDETLPPLDEFVYLWGDPVDTDHINKIVGAQTLSGGTFTSPMGTLADADGAWAMRAPDFTSGGAEFHWIEFENCIWVLRTDWYTSPFGSGVGVNCELPDPGVGSGFKWIHPDLSAYTNSISQRSTSGQNNILNSGNDVASGGSYGVVNLKPAYAAMLVKALDI